jgi:translation initiation factor IF-2
MSGDVQDVEVSAKARTGLDTLIEKILLQAELLELKANPERSADATVIEAQLDKGRGPVATVLVNRGTLRTGDVFVVGSESGRVRALVDDKGKQVKEAGPSSPVEVLGLAGVPLAGDHLTVVENEQRARDRACVHAPVRPEAHVLGGDRRLCEERRQPVGREQRAARPAPGPGYVQPLPVTVEHHRGRFVCRVEEPGRKRTEANPESETDERRERQPGPPGYQ